MRSLSRPQNSTSSAANGSVAGGISYGSGLPAISNHGVENVPRTKAFAADFDGYFPYGRNARRAVTSIPAARTLVASKSSNGLNSASIQQQKQQKGPKYYAEFAPYAGTERSSFDQYADEKDHSAQSYYSAPAFGVGDDFESSNLAQFNTHVDAIRKTLPSLTAIDDRRKNIENRRAAQLAASSSTGSSTTATNSSRWKNSESTRSSSDIGSALGSGYGYSERPTGDPYTDPRFNILSNTYQPASYVSMLAPPSSADLLTPTPSISASTKKEKRKDRNRPKFDRIGSGQELSSSDGRSHSPRPPSDQDAQSEYQPSNLYAAPQLPSGSAKEPSTAPLIGLKRNVQSLELRARFGLMDIKRKLGRIL